MVGRLSSQMGCLSHTWDAHSAQSENFPYGHFETSTASNFDERRGLLPIITDSYSSSEQTRSNAIRWRSGSGLFLDLARGPYGDLGKSSSSSSNMASVPSTASPRGRPWPVTVFSSWPGQKKSWSSFANFDCDTVTAADITLEQCNVCEPRLLSKLKEMENTAAGARQTMNGSAGAPLSEQSKASGEAGSADLVLADLKRILGGIQEACAKLRNAPPPPAEAESEMPIDEIPDMIAAESVDTGCLSTTVVGRIDLKNGIIEGCLNPNTGTLEVDLEAANKGRGSASITGGSFRVED